jgi:RNA polymerase sigma-70 factor (ECF subfamily)
MPSSDLLPAEELARAMASGKAAWPGIELAPEAFARHLAERLEPGASVAALAVSDLYLACACAQGSAGAVEAFSRRFCADLGAALRPVGAAAMADDVRQVLLERLFVGGPEAPPRIGTYAGKGPLSAWVRVSAVRLAVSLQRAERPAEPMSDERLAEALVPAVDPELDALKLRYAAEFNAALREAFAALPPRERTLLKLHYVDGVTVERLAGVYNAHRVSVSRWLSAARVRVLEETSRLLREHRQLTETEFESLVRLLRSQIDLSLRSVVG